MDRTHAVVVFFDDAEDAAKFTMTLGLDQRSDARMVKVNELSFNFEGVQPNQGSMRARFIQAISDYSESRWAAGWMSGIEQDIRSEGGHWTLLAVAAGGWPVGCRGDQGWLPVTDDERQKALAYLIGAGR